MTDPLPEPGPPLVIRVEDEPPFVVMVEPVTRVKLPRPGLFEAGILTTGFAAVLFGTMIAIVLAAFGILYFFGDADGLKGAEDAKPGSIDALPPALAQTLAWSFPIAYLAGLGYAVLILRLVVGRTWVWEVGLHRLPPVHLGLGILALPAFILMSDTLAKFLFRLFGMDEFLDQSGDLGEVFRPFHWSFVVLAVGVGPGVVEELWCRGFLGRGLIGRYGWIAGVLLTSLLFGMLHIYPPPYVLVTAAMGACLHFTYVMSRSLWVPIAIHTLNNSFAGLAAIGAIPLEAVDHAMAERAELVGFLAIGLLLSTAAAMWSARARVEPAASVPHRGAMVPLPEADAVVIDHRPHLVLALAAMGCAAGLIGVLFG